MITNASLTTYLHGVAASVAPSIYDKPDPARTWGISISPWSHLIDWQKFKAAGGTFAIIKMIDGVQVAPYAEANYKAAKDADVLVGGYGWLYTAAKLSPGAQARALVAFLKDHPCDIRPGPDFEWNTSGNPTFDDLYGYTQPFADGYGKPAMPYTAPGYWNDPKQIKSGSQLGPKSPYWATLPLWAAEYRTKNSAYIPFGLWAQCKILQFSATGQGALYGYPTDGEKEAELNYWQGSLADLLAWCGSATVPPVVPPPVVAPPTVETLEQLTADVADIKARLTKGGL